MDYKIPLLIPILIASLFIAKESVAEANNITWPREILSGVTLVNTSSSPLCTLVVYGAKAEPILTASNADEVVIAAAELAKGRLLAFSGTIFAKDLLRKLRILGNSRYNGNNTKLYDNVEKWLMKGKKVNASEVLKLPSTATENTIRSQSQLNPYKILIQETQNKNEIVNSSWILAYIKSGGSLIYSIDLEHYFNVNGGNINRVPYVSVLTAAGIGLQVDRVHINGEKILVNSNKASQSHIGRLITDTHATLDSLLTKYDRLNRLTSIANIQDIDLFKKLDSFWKQSESRINSTFKSDGRINVNSLVKSQLVNFWTFGAALSKLNRFKAPFIDNFPGDFKTFPKFINASINVSSSYSQINPTGLYVAAGQSITIKLVSFNQSWEALIGSQTRSLSHNLEAQRWPVVVVRSLLDELNKTYTINTPYGGLLYLRSLKNEPSFINVKITHVVESPFFDLKDNLHNTQAAWNRRRGSAQGLWGDISGKYITFSVPSNFVKSLTDVKPIVEFYDKVIDAYHNLTSTNASKRRREWVTVDKETGFLSGYPIILPFDRLNNSNIFNITSLKANGSFSLFHEIGHMVLENKWTFHGNSESLSNLFALYGLNKLCNLTNIWQSATVQHNLPVATKFLEEGKNIFNDWPSNNLALLFYAQLSRDFTWNAYKRVFEKYANLKTFQPKTDQERIDKWIHLFSVEADRNILPLALYWGIPVSTDVNSTITRLNMINYMPDDSLTKKTPKRIAFVRNAYPVWNRRS